MPTANDQRSFYRDPDVEDEQSPAYIAAQLRPDDAFAGEQAVRRFPFDEDQADALICHVQGGCAVKVGPRDMRRAFVDGTTGDPGLDDVLVSVLAELGVWSLRHTFEHSGASPREIAAFYRSRPGAIRWPVVLCLNPWSDLGQRDLPFVLDKLAAVDCDHPAHF